MNCRHVWFSLSPKYTTVRVNLQVATMDETVAFIFNSLSKEAEKRDMSVPAVYQHPAISDCVVIPPWRDEDGLYQSLPRYEHEVIVDAACGVAVLRGAHIFAPGVLGMPSCTQQGDLVSVYADGSSCCKRGLTVPFSDPGKVFLGNGIVRMSRKSLFEKDLHPKGLAVEIVESASGVASVSIPQHLGILQNLPSIVCSHVVGPQPNEKVIDLCAAPGHKTTHLAALMDNKGVLVALDKIARKVEALRSLCKTMEADCVKAFVYNSINAVSNTPGPNWSPPYVPGTFDRVLLDAPCSALGQRPQIGNKITSKQIESYPKLQKKLFATAVQLLRLGGTLVYSTCSLTTEENENLVGWALNKYPQLELVPATPLLGKQGVEQSSLSKADCQKVQRFGPPLGPQPEDDTIGFFIAKFVKVS